jgi:hypothetical protein
MKLLYFYPIIKTPIKLIIINYLKYSFISFEIDKNFNKNFNYKVSNMRDLVKMIKFY